MRLNQPIIQLVNYVAYPAQLVTLIPFYRAGESLFNRPHLPLSIPMLMDRFRDDAGKFLSDFGIVAVYGILVWCLIAAIYFAITWAISVRTRNYGLLDVAFS